MIELKTYTLKEIKKVLYISKRQWDERKEELLEYWKLFLIMKCGLGFKTLHLTFLILYVIICQTSYSFAVSFLFWRYDTLYHYVLCILYLSCYTLLFQIICFEYSVFIKTIDLALTPFPRFPSFLFAFV